MILVDKSFFQNSQLKKLEAHKVHLLREFDADGASILRQSPELFRFLLLLTFQGFDAQGNSLGTIALSQGQIGDKRNDGTTVDDRFFGVINLAGISAISISQALIDVGFAVDHLQYGSVYQSSQPVSEPSGIFGLLGFSLFGLGAFCKRKLN